MVKRGIRLGQISIFIVIAIIVVFAIILFFVFSGSFSTGTIPEKENVRSFVENCIQESGSDIVYRIGEGGGYYFPPEFSTDSGVTYYYSNKKSHMPTKEQIQDEISFYLGKKLFFCTKNFIDFPDFQITQGNIDVKTKISENDVIFNVNYPINIQKGRSSVKLENFNNIRVPIRLGILYDSAKNIIEEQKNHNGICMNCLLNVSLKYDFYADLLDYDETSVIFIFRDEKSKINEKPFRFVFANKYELTNAE